LSHTGELEKEETIRDLEQEMAIRNMGLENWKKERQLGTEEQGKEETIRNLGLKN
jgi:hypothetical protein